MIQISTSGFLTDDAAIEGARADFQERGCAVLPQFLKTGLANRLSAKLEDEVCQYRIHYRSYGVESSSELGRELTFERSSVQLSMYFLLNNPSLFAAIERIIGCSPVRCFHGRVFRAMPREGHALDWHNDAEEGGRLVGFSINLSPSPYQGGLFRLRRRSDGEILTEVSHAEPGGAHLFSIHRTLEHCVTPVEGSVPRTACAGWFRSAPDREEVLRGLFDR